MPEGSHLYCDVSLPVLDAELLALGRWIAGYYCAPLGEVLRGMLPLASEIRRGKVWPLSRHLLDTNIIGNVTKPAPSAALVAWMAEQADEDLFISSLTVAEIRCGLRAEDRLERGVPWANRVAGTNMWHTGEGQLQGDPDGGERH